MSEATIKTGLATAIRAMSEFATADVVLDDWSVLDLPSSNAPYAIIETSDDFVSRQDTMEPVTRWEIPITLIVEFVDWSSSMVELGTLRQALIDKINTDDIRSAGGLEGVTIDELRSSSPVTPMYDQYLSQEEASDSEPTYLGQRIVAISEEY